MIGRYYSTDVSIWHLQDNETDAASVRSILMKPVAFKANGHCEQFDLMF